MGAALDAYLVQLQAPVELQCMTEEKEPAGVPTIAKMQNFVVIPLSHQVLEGFQMWGIALPTITSRNAHQREAVSPPTKQEA